MSVFSDRSTLYKAGVFLLVFASALFVIGYGAPYWIEEKREVTNSLFGRISAESHQGLWMLCSSRSGGGFDSFSCATYSVSGQPGWFHAVRALECVCLVVLAIACIYTLASNCCKTIPGPHSRLLEILAGVGGLLGFVGAMVYVGEFNDAIKSAEGANFSWAFYLATIGSVLAVVAAILVGIGNKPLPQQSGGTTFNMAPVTTSYPATVTTVQGGYYPGQQPYGAAPPQKAGYPS